MADITLNAAQFKDSYARFNGGYTIPVPLRTWLRASLTVGFQSWPELLHAGKRQFLDRVISGWRARLWLTQHGAGLCLADEFEHVEQSEKVSISFWNGMILAKIVADEHLHIPWLINVEDMRKQGRLTMSTVTNERGDLVGKDRHGDWHAIEAKGRSNAVSPTLIRDAKTQAETILSIDGVPPKTRSACVSHLGETPIQVTLVDPPGRRGNREKHLATTDANFWAYYYGNLASYIREWPQRYAVEGLPDYKFAPAPLPQALPSSSELEVVIGLPIALLEAPASASQLQPNVGREAASYVGADAVALAGRLPEWSQAGRDLF